MKTAAEDAPDLPSSKHEIRNPKPRREGRAAVAVCAASPWAFDIGDSAFGVQRLELGVLFLPGSPAPRLLCVFASMRLHPSAPFALGRFVPAPVPPFRVIRDPSFRRKHRLQTARRPSIFSALFK
jgi:hypothetical protein